MEKKIQNKTDGPVEEARKSFNKPKPKISRVETDPPPRPSVKKEK